MTAGTRKSWRPSATWSALFLAITVGCSSEQKNLLITQACEGACDGGNAAADSGGAAPKVELGVCFGEAIDCESPIEVLPYEPAPEKICDPVDAGVAEVEWLVLLDDIQCGVPSCSRVYPSLKILPSGGLQMAAAIYDPNYEYSALWFGELDAAGGWLDSTTRETFVGARLVMPKIIRPPAVVDAMGRWLAIQYDILSTPGADPELSTMRVLRFASPDAAAERIIEVGNVVPQSSLAVAPDGGFAMHFIWDDGTYDSSDHDPPVRTDVARFDENGRLLWNQIKTSEALDLTDARLLGFDADGDLHLTVQRQAVYADEPIQLTNGGWPALSQIRIVEIDPSGNVITVRDRPTPTQSLGGSVVLAPDGSYYGVLTPLHSVGTLYEVGAPRVERIGAEGRSEWSLDLGFSPGDEVSVRAGLDGEVHVLRTRTDAGVVEVYVVEPDGDVCQRYTVPCTDEEGANRLCSTTSFEVSAEGIHYWVQQSDSTPPDYGVARVRVPR